MRKYRARRRKLVDAIKTQSGCVDCGYNNLKYPGTLEFDHVRGEKKFSIGEAATLAVPLERIMEEIEKCEVVCAICHRIRTIDRNQDTYPK